MNINRSSLLSWAPISALAALSLGGCLFTNETKPPLIDGPMHAGMKIIPAKGKVFRQGAIGGGAKPDESPVLINGFSADFRMDSIEVTQAFFKDVTGREPVPVFSSFGYGNRHPVHGVSWYDAVLFCNARSRMYGLDTVYDFAGLSRNVSGGVYRMEGMSIHLERKGFRLPTEAEWEFAARAGSESAFSWGDTEDSSRAAAHAWYSGNSGNRCQPVGTRIPNAFGIYDMAGNVMEWVNDWKAPYPAEGVSDFAGARDPGAEFEKPVKGGAYNYGLSELRPANRSATYATIPSAAMEYVGFRCVLGALPGARFFAPDGRPAATGPISPKVSRIHAKLSGRGAKLVFINASATRRQLVYLDFRSSPPLTREFTDFDKAFHPAISPDGNWVAFGTGLEGSEELSEVFVRRLDDFSSIPQKVGEGFIPRWGVDPARQDTFLLFSNTAVDNQSTRWSATRTLRRKMAGGQPVGEPTSMTENGGFHDGISKNGRYLATGYRLLKVRDLISGKTSTLFTAPQNGKADGDTSQVCNVSIAPDTTGNVLFLDFGYPGASRVVGSRYGIHHIAFLAGPTGRVSRWFRAPQGEEAWADLEWSNHPDYAVTAATNPAGEQKNLYLVNLRDSVYTALAEGANLMHPGLWVATGSDFPASAHLDFDSLGLYNEPATFDGQSILAVKMHHFWKYHGRTEGFFLGSSQLADAVDPREFIAIQGLNLAFGAGGMKAADMLIGNYILPHATKVKLIGISVPIGHFNIPGMDMTWNLIHPGSKGFMYDSTHGFWRAGLPADFAEIIAGVPYPNRSHVDTLGLVSFPSRGWGPEKPGEAPGIDWDVMDPVYLANMEAFENRIVELSERRIHFLFLIIPHSPRYQAMRSYSYMGPSWTTARAIIKDMESLQARYPYFHFLDLHKDGEHGYVEEEAFDESHLSEPGARKMSRALDAEIRAFLSGSRSGPE